MKRILLLWILAAMLLGTGYAQQEACVSDDEVALANLVNQLRKQNDLEIIPLSASLTYVADVHVKDLYLHYNPLGSCNLLSWSDNGRWSACCVEGDDLGCMLDKPYELAEYKSKGYELVFYQNTQVTSGLAFNAWKVSPQAQHLFLQKGRYSDKQWQAMGVAIFDGYASIWFGELTDNAGEPLLCSERERKREKQADTQQQQEDSSVQQEAEKEIEYYVIVASHRSDKEAQAEATSYQQQDYHVVTLRSGKNYRVALGPFAGYSKAEEVKNVLTSDTRKPWILKAGEE